MALWSLLDSAPVFWHIPPPVIIYLRMLTAFTFKTRKYLLQFKSSWEDSLEGLSTYCMWNCNTHCVRTITHRNFCPHLFSCLSPRQPICQLGTALGKCLLCLLLVPFPTVPFTEEGDQVLRYPSFPGRATTRLPHTRLCSSVLPPFLELVCSGLELAGDDCHPSFPVQVR
jgi:hypothetical protein